MQFTEEDISGFLQDTAKLVQQEQIQNLGTAVASANQAGILADNVEFWKWLTESYPKFSDSSVLQQAAKEGTNNISRILQGKGYEWDFMTAQRNMPVNVTRRFVADTNATQIGFDVEGTDLLTGERQLFQNKAYTSKTAPHLKNTTTDIQVVTNQEQVLAVQRQGYDTQAFQDAETIRKNTDARLQQAAEGEASAVYTLKNVGGAMAKAGLIGIAVGVTTETLFSYQDWKNGRITTQEYLKEIAKSGGEGGLTSAATAGIMIPVSAALTAAGLAAAPITVPVSFVLSIGINKIIAPMFGRGDYKKILGEAKYYQNLMNMHTDLANALELSAQQFEAFVLEYQNQLAVHENLTQINTSLKDAHQQTNAFLTQKQEETQQMFGALGDLYAKI